MSVYVPSPVAPEPVCATLSSNFSMKLTTDRADLTVNGLEEGANIKSIALLADSAALPIPPTIGVVSLLKVN